MVKTASTMLPLGSAAPDFTLGDVVTERDVSRSDFEGRPLLVMFICNHCPYVVHVREQLAALGRDYLERMAIVAISSNDAEAYPADAPDAMKREAEEAGYVFPYLFDESQAVAKAYRAACTPDFFLFDGEHRLRYRGQLDDARPGKDAPADGKDLRAAMEAVLAGGEVDDEQRPSLGCNIKWKPGQAPEYFG